ncbi:Bromodomain-containing factor 1 [Seminavis robusta]|uniref:Bromodomain-containing factor 1 n=1 Tax=Seminavis robusta TaxID=568900 RepID=A0A9N8D4C7_9STRA|nr:Bromodomain-containing factor 1 [Seminavis robusta]|eukprot:Sro2_g001490.1 Bromodomain-containing factor 1 (1470) ;mRNA; f:166039-170997
MSMSQEDLDKCRQVAKNLMSEKYKKYNQLFIEPFPLDSVPGYLDVVDKKLDIKTLAANLDAGIYKSRKDFFDDAALIFHNAIKYHSNKETKWIIKPAKEMLKVVQRELKNLDKRPSKILTKQRGGSLKLKMGTKKKDPTASKLSALAAASAADDVPSGPSASNPPVAMPSSTLSSDAAAAPPKPKVSLKLKTGGSKMKDKIAPAKAKPTQTKPTQPKLKLKISLSKKASAPSTETTPRPTPSASPIPPTVESNSSSSKPPSVKISAIKIEKPPKVLQVPRVHQAPKAQQIPRVQQAPKAQQAPKVQQAPKLQQIRLAGPRGKELPKGVATSTTSTTKKATTKTATGKVPPNKATSGKSSSAKATASTKTSSSSSTSKTATSTKSATGKVTATGKATKKTGTKKTTTKKAKKSSASSVVAPPPPPPSSSSIPVAPPSSSAAAPVAAPVSSSSSAAAASTTHTAVSSSSSSSSGAGAMMTPIRKIQCSKIISGLKRRKHKAINIFLHPVSDKNIIQTYKAKIKHPMCISAMQNKLDKNEYRSVAQFVLDMRRIFANCLRFNTSMKDRLRPLAVELLSTAEDLMVTFLIRGKHPPPPAGGPDLYPPLLYCWSFCIKVLNTLFNLTNPVDSQPTVYYFLHPVTTYCGGQYPPDYLNLVKRPMDFGTITSNLIEGIYQNVDEFASDCRLVIENCRTFYGGREDGKLFIDQADQLKRVLTQQLDAFDRYLKSSPGLELKAKATTKKSPNGPALFPKPPDSLLTSILDELRAMKYTDKATKITENAMAPFEKPVSLADYTDYLQYVKTPMDLQSVERKIKGGQYEMPEDFEYDMGLVFKNCETYNAHRKGGHLVAMSKYGAKQFRRLFSVRMRTFEDPSSVTTKEEQKEASSSSINPSSKKAKVENTAGGPKGKAAPRISITAAQVSSAAAQVAKAPKLPSVSSSNKKNNQPAAKANQPVPLHIAIARVKEAYPLRRAHKSLQNWEADCARFFKELMRHPWISAARPKFIFHVPVPVLFPGLKEVYMMKISKPMDLTTCECNLLEGNRYSSADDFLQDIALVFSNAITFNKDGKEIGDPMSYAYYDASIHLLRYSRWLSLELLSSHLADIDTVDEGPEGDEKLPPLSWKLTTGNRKKGRSEMESIVMNEPIDKSVEGDRFTWMESECEKLLKALRHQSDIKQMTFFIVPNYPPDYAAFISKPMDWKTVSDTLKNREYDTFAEICADLRLIFSNALKYNARHQGTTTVSGRAYDAATYMSAKLETAINKMLLSVSDRLERERIDHANAEREIEAAEQAEEERIRATWKKESTTENGPSAPATGRTDGSVKVRAVRKQMKRRESTDFEIPYFDEEDDGQHERSYFDAVKQQKALFERQRQDLAKMRQNSMTTGAAMFARLLQRQKAKTWLGAVQYVAKKGDVKDEKQSAPGATEAPAGQQGSSVLTALEKEGRERFKINLAVLPKKNKKRKRSAITFE